jgi:putative heme-binding domain-containing protein
LLRDSDAQVRLAAFLGLADQPPTDLAAAALARALRAGVVRGDAWLADAATAAAARNDAPFLKTLAARSAAGPAGPETLEIAAIVAEHWARGGPTDKVGALLASLSGGEPAVNESILRGLARGWPKGRPAVVDQATEAVLKQLTLESTAVGRAQLVRLAGLWGNQALGRMGTEIASALLAAVKDEKLSESRRVNAALQLVELRANDFDAAKQLLDSIAPGTASELAAGLVEAVALSKAPQVGQALVEILSKVVPAVRARVLRIMLGRADWSPALVEALERNRVQVSELALDQKQALSTHPNREIAERAKKLLARGGGLPDPDRQKVLEKLAPLLKEGGDPARGKLVFVQQCAKCHRHGGEGGQVGPDLSGMAAIPRNELLIHILDPSRNVEGTFVQYSVATTDGRVISGLLASETKTSVELIDAEAKRHIVLREDIDQMAASKKSLMPEGFEKQVTVSELNDILAFLTQRGKYVPLDLHKAATIASSRGMFYDANSQVERLIFPDWTPKTVDGVPFVLLDPQGGRVPNAVLLYSPEGKFPPQMPKAVEIPCNSPARAIHFLSGVSGWGYPYGRKGTVSLIVRIHYIDGTVEDHPLENGVHFADYVRVVDVPGSKLAFTLRDQQIRYLAVQPKKQETIQRIELVKGPDESAPIVMAVTIERGNGE